MFIGGIQLRRRAGWVRWLRSEYAMGWSEAVRVALSIDLEQ